MIFLLKKFFLQKNYIKNIIMIKNLIYVTNNGYKNSSLASTIEWVLWKINSFEVFDLQGACLLLRVLALKVRV